MGRDRLSRLRAFIRRGNSPPRSWTTRTHVSGTQPTVRPRIQCHDTVLKVESCPPVLASVAKYALLFVQAVVMHIYGRHMPRPMAATLPWCGSPKSHSLNTRNKLLHEIWDTMVRWMDSATFVLFVLAIKNCRTPHQPPRRPTPTNTCVCLSIAQPNQPITQPHDFLWLSCLFLLFFVFVCFFFVSSFFSATFVCSNATLIVC